MSDKIKDLLEAMKFVFLLVDGSVKSMENKKWDWISDPMNFLPAAKALIPAVQGIENISAQMFKELSIEDQEEVKQFFKDEFDVPDDEVEEVVEDTFVTVMDVKFLVQKWIKVLSKKDDPEVVE